MSRKPVIKRTTLSLPQHLMDKLEAIATERGQTISTMVAAWAYELPEPRGIPKPADPVKDEDEPSAQTASPVDRLAA